MREQKIQHQMSKGGNVGDWIMWERDRIARWKTWGWDKG